MCAATLVLGAAVAAAPIVVAMVGGLAVLAALIVTRTTPLLFAVLVLLQPLVPPSLRPVPFIGLNLQEWTLVLGLVLGIVVLLGRILAGEVRGGVSLPWLDYLVLGLFLWTGLSLLQASDPDRTTRLFLRVMCFSCEMYVLGRWFWSHWSLEHVAGTLVVAGLVTTVLLWVEFLAGQPLYVSEEEYLANWVVGGFRAGSMLSGPNFASVFLAQTFAAAAYMFVYARRRWRWLWLGASIALASGLVATQSISGMIQFIVVVLALAWPRLSWAMRIGLVMLAVGSLFSPLPQAIMDNPLVASHSVSIYGRFDLLETARTAIGSLWTDLSTMLFGIGYWRESVIESQFGVGSIAGVGRDVSLHNAFLTLAIESGLPAAALYTAILLNLARGLRRGQASSSQGIAGLAGAAFVVASISGTTTTLPQVFGAFLFMAAGAAGSHGKGTADQ